MNIHHLSVLDDQRNEDAVAAVLVSFECSIRINKHDAQQGLVSVLPEGLIVTVHRERATDAAGSGQALPSPVKFTRASIRRRIQSALAARDKHAAAVLTIEEDSTCACCLPFCGGDDFVVNTAQMHAQQKRLEALHSLLQPEHVQAIAAKASAAVPICGPLQHFVFPRVEWRDHRSHVVLAACKPAAHIGASPGQVDAAVEEHLECMQSGSAVLPEIANPIHGSGIESHAAVRLELSPAALVRADRGQKETGQLREQSNEESAEPSTAPAQGFGALQSKGRLSGASASRAVEPLVAALSEWGDEYKTAQQPSEPGAGPGGGHGGSSGSDDAVLVEQHCEGSPSRGQGQRPTGLDLRQVASGAASAKQLLLLDSDGPGSQPAASGANYAASSGSRSNGPFAHEVVSCTSEIMRVAARAGVSGASSQQPPGTGSGRQDDGSLAKIQGRIKQIWFVARELLVTECSGALDACTTDGVLEASLTGRGGRPEAPASRGTHAAERAESSTSTADPPHTTGSDGAAATAAADVSSAAAGLREHLVNAGVASWSQDAPRQLLRAVPVPQCSQAVQWFGNNLGHIAKAVLAASEDGAGGLASVQADAALADRWVPFLAVCSTICTALKERFIAQVAADDQRNGIQVASLLPYCRRYARSQATRRRWRDAADVQWKAWESACGTAASTGIVSLDALKRPLVPEAEPGQARAASGADSQYAQAGAFLVLKPRPEARSLDNLESALVRPVQRACRYPLLAHALASAADKALACVEEFAGGAGGERGKADGEAGVPSMGDTERIAGALSALAVAARSLESSAASFAAAVNQCASEAEMDRALQHLHAQLLRGNALAPGAALPPHDVVAPGRKLGWCMPDAAQSGPSTAATTKGGTIGWVVMWDRHDHPLAIRPVDSAPPLIRGAGADEAGSSASPGDPAIATLVLAWASGGADAAAAQSKQSGSSVGDGAPRKAKPARRLVKPGATRASKMLKRKRAIEATMMVKPKVEKGEGQGKASFRRGGSSGASSEGTPAGGGCAAGMPRGGSAGPGGESGEAAADWEWDSSGPTPAILALHGMHVLLPDQLLLSTGIAQASSGSPIMIAGDAVVPADGACSALGLAARVDLGRCHAPRELYRISDASDAFAFDLFHSWSAVGGARGDGSTLAAVERISFVFAGRVAAIEARRRLNDVIGKLKEGQNALLLQSSEQAADEDRCAEGVGQQHIDAPGEMPDLSAAPRETGRRLTMTRRSSAAVRRRQDALAALVGKLKASRTDQG